MKIRKPELPRRIDVRQLRSKADLAQLKKKMPIDMVFLSQFVSELDLKQQGPLIRRSYKVFQALHTVWRMKMEEDDVQAEYRAVEWNNVDRIKENLRQISLTREEHCRLSVLQQDEIETMLKSNPLYYEAACIAEDVYFDEPHDLPGGWRRSDDHTDLRYRDIQGCGLKSSLYEREAGEGKEYIYATAGTNPFDEKDWQNNLYQVVGDSPQYDLALDIAGQLSARIGEAGGRLMFVGHSLGGGEATLNALATGHPAIVFNPAGLSVITMAKNHADQTQADKLITNFITDNDVLNWMQDCASHIKVWDLLVPTSIGKKYYLPMSGMSRYGHNMPPIEEYMKRVSI